MKAKKQFSYFILHTSSFMRKRAGHWWLPRTSNPVVGGYFRSTVGSIPIRFRPTIKGFAASCHKPFSLCWVRFKAHLNSLVELLTYEIPDILQIAKVDNFVK